MKDQSIGSLVAEDYRRAQVFKKHGIDFCCGGGKTVAEVCAQKGIDFPKLESELKAAVDQKDSGDTHANEWPLDVLIDHILKKHHVYVRESLPLLIEFSQKVARVHGEANPEVIKIAALVDELAQELGLHMMKEERILFPYILQLVAASKSGDTPSPPFQTVRNPVRMMELEHDHAGENMKQIRELSGDFTPPDHACNTYRVAYFKLKEFEEDLHRHIHLENNILFPKAVEMETALMN